MKISVVFGTRPEAIKLCPLVLELRNDPFFNVNVCITGQHREMLDQVLEVFKVVPDYDLKLMSENQTLSSLTSKAINKLDGYFKIASPDLVIVQGDTTSAFCAGLAAFYNNIRVGHVEAGLRTGNKQSPFPEEINRKLLTGIADLHFAPTVTAQDNLLKESISPNQVFVTGNTVIDAMKFTINVIDNSLPQNFLPPTLYTLVNKHTNDDIILITGHRRENFGEGFKNICNAIAKLSMAFREKVFIYPVHLNPNVRQPVNSLLGEIPNVFLIEPLEYLPFLYLMRSVKIILTDSGGIQEEAPYLGKPVVILRNTTERQEVIKSGSAILAGTQVDSIYNNVHKLLTNPEFFNRFAVVKNPYGDGTSASKISNIIKKYAS